MVYLDFITFRLLWFFAVLLHSSRREEKRYVAVDDIERIEQLLAFN